MVIQNLNKLPVGENNINQLMAHSLTGSSYLKRMIIDVETRSHVNLTQCGAYAYSVHPSTEILCLGYGTTLNDIKLWKQGDNPPHDLFVHIATGHLIEAFNAFFERCIWENICKSRLGWIGIPEKLWRCLQARSYAYGMSGGNLDNISKFLKLKEQKSESGKEIIKIMSMPKRGKFIDTPELRNELYQYCIQDVRTEIELSNTIPELSPTELEIWQVDQRINWRGIKCDTQFAENALDLFDKYRNEINNEVELITGGIVDSVTKIEKIKIWLTHYEIYLDELDKDNVTNLLNSKNLPEHIKIVLDYRQQGGKSSIAKFAKIKDYSVNNRLHGLFTYCGAHTRRWSSYGVQLQNLARPIHPDDEKQDISIYELQSIRNAIIKKDTEYLEMIGQPLRWIANSVRSAFIPNGKFIDVDFAGIEMRMLWWLAGEDQLIDLILNKQDIYKHTASAIFSKPIPEITKEERHTGKIVELGSGYQLGAARLQQQVEKKGKNWSLSFCEQSIRAYRDTHQNVVRLWYSAQDAAKSAIQNPGSNIPVLQTFNPGNGKIVYRCENDKLFCRLPNGRYITYWYPRLEFEPAPWDINQKIEQIIYETPHRGSTKLYGGKLVENFDQAICRDLLATALIAVDKQALHPVLTAHDEILFDEPSLDRLNEILKIMKTCPEWLSNFPLDVSYWTGDFYRKD